jgi:imidazolonepropionase
MKKTGSSGIKTAWVKGILATMDPGVDREYGLVKDRVMITQGGIITGIVAPDSPELRDCGERIDLAGALVTPGLIDCHTHLVFAGRRAREWESRLKGVSYQDIAAAGGGIQATVQATRRASFAELYEAGEQRLKAMTAEGVTTVEIKSGYGLDLPNERKILEVIRALKAKTGLDISPTLLAAHSVPGEYAGRGDTYIAEICHHILPELWAEGLFEAVDVFCENIAFSLEQTERLFRAAAALGIPLKGHNEQMSNLGGSALLARYGGWSTDHLERLDEAGVRALRESGTAAVLLPMAFYFLRDTHLPPVSLLRRYGIPMAVATDYNPGTSPFTSIRQAMNMACTLFGLTPEEALAGVTRHGALALGRANSHGQLKRGYRADFAVWAVEEPVEIFYELGPHPLRKLVINGRVSLFGR